VKKEQTLPVVAKAPLLQSRPLFYHHSPKIARYYLEGEKWRRIMRVSFFLQLACHEKEDGKQPSPYQGDPEMSLQACHFLEMTSVVSRYVI
jgi:hypothetical protein